MVYLCSGYLSIQPSPIGGTVDYLPVVGGTLMDNTSTVVGFFLQIFTRH